MSTHRIHLDTIFENQLVGNSMSTTATYDGKNLTINWKKESQSFLAKQGSKALVSCNGGFPKVVIMTPPGNPIAKAAWERGFYANKRYPTLVDLQNAADKLTRYSVPHGYDVSNYWYFKSDAGNCAFVFKLGMDGQVGTPWGWWASPEVKESEVREYLKVVFKDDVPYIQG